MRTRLNLLFSVIAFFLGIECGWGQNADRHFTRVSLADLVEMIRADGLIRVNYIEPSYSSTAGLTAGKRISDIEAVPSEQRSKGEQEQLTALKRMAANPGGDKLIIGFPYKRFDVDLSAMGTPAGLTEAISQVLKQYAPTFQAIRSNGAVAIFEKDCKEANFKTSIDLKHASPAEALQAMKKLLQQAGVGFVDIGFSKNYMPRIPGEINLSIDNESLPLVLTRITEVFGNDLVWTIRGQEGFRMLQFNQSPISR